MMWCFLPRYSIWLLVIFSLAGHVTTFSLPGCNSADNFDIVQSQQPSLTCTGLTAGHNIYWSITDPSSQEETRIAECEKCNPKCPTCSDPIAGYNVSRDSNETTTLQFLNSSLVTSESTIKCSAFLNHTNATCRLFVVPAYTISDCREHAVTIKDGMETSIRCEGIVAAQNMYWTLTYLNRTVSTIAYCNACLKNRASCPGCNMLNGDFNVTRKQNSSTLVIQNNFKQTDGATLRCSKKDNKTHDDCTINVEYILEDASVTLHDNWTVTGSFRMSKVPTSDSNATCVWYYSSKKQLSTSKAILTPYDDSRRNISYNNVSCQLNAVLNNYTEGNNTISVALNSNHGPVTAGNVIIEQPGPLMLDTSACLMSVTEGSTVTCTCKYTGGRHGNPPGRVSWTNNTGPDVLVLPDLQQNLSGVVHVCRSLWGPHDEVFDTLSYSITVSAQFIQEQATGLPVAAVAGSAVGFVFIVAVVIGIAVILKRRRSKGTTKTESQDSVPTDDEFEEHINEFYQSADDTDVSRHSPPNSPAPLSLANPSVDPQGAGSDGPQNHVYAQVNKEKKKKLDVSEEQPGTTHDVKQHAQGGKTQKHADKGENQGPSSEEQGAVYTECVSDSKIDNSVTNVYMNVDESPPRPTDQDTQAAKKDSGNVALHEPDPNTYYNTDTTRHQGDYTNVQPELHEAEGMTKTAKSADDYRHL
ncbi:uncharacterized protein [Littorina saxatilis]|uniref:uncharacterized protein isoform X2 n=1 Tax=Littorina saxatilis TaxID=31220 RepID=UPI0038B5C9BF